jgi:hypothetical protein
MQHMLDGSKAICRVCGASRALTRDAGSAHDELAAFSAAHGIHDAFRVDVVAGATPIRPIR